jgi:hypothetical protein
MKSCGLCLTWALAACAALAASLAHAADLAPRDFANGYRIVSSSEASAYRVTLPLVIYQGTVRDDLGDLAVFNARGEVVPFFIRPLPAETRPAQPPAFLPLFPLLGTTPATAAEMRVTVNSPGVALTLSSSGAAPGIVPRQYLLDARALEESVAALQLVWEHAPAGFSGRLRIESSDDLDSWRMVVAAAPVASLQAGGQEFLQARIELPPARAKYWRLSWVDAVPSAAITKVLAEFAQAHADPGWTSETVQARQDAPGDYVFDLGGHVPVERVDLQLAEANSVVAADLYSRKDPRDAWNLVTRARIYRIHTPRGDDQSEPIAVPLNRDRYWLARIPNPASAGDLALTAAWRPSELIFLFSARLRQQLLDRGTHRPHSVHCGYCGAAGDARRRRKARWRGASRRGQAALSQAAMDPVAGPARRIGGARLHGRPPPRRDRSATASELARPRA